MAKTPEEHECKHILIVEGYSDLLFCAAMLRYLKRSNGVFIKEFKGKSNILNRDTLGDYLTPKRLTEKQTIGVILDADDNPAGAAQSIADRLREITGRTLTEGQWQAGEPRLGFFVAPARDTVGEIETLAWNAFPEDAKHRQMKEAVSGYLATMEPLGWKPKSPDKGRIAAYLAAAYDEDARLGPGAREGKFPFDAPGFARLRTFLEVLPVSA
jgi:hypothetical protein